MSCGFRETPSEKNKGKGNQEKTPDINLSPPSNVHIHIYNNTHTHTQSQKQVGKIAIILLILFFPKKCLKDSKPASHKKACFYNKKVALRAANFQVSSIQSCPRGTQQGRKKQNDSRSPALFY